MTTYRNDLDAAYARIEALERENRALKEAIDMLRATRAARALPPRPGRKRTIEGPLYELGLATKTFGALTSWFRV